MKSTYKYTFLLPVAFAIAAMLSGCSEDDLPNNGRPLIEYIRVTDPAASDSLLISAGQGQMIAVVGQNLQGAKEMWINDRRAALNPSFITSTTIITRVPSQIPGEISNKMKLVFAGGDSLIYDFIVSISRPLISYMRSEYVNTGDVAVISGDYFYEPLTVTFSGGIEGELVSVEDQMLRVRVPEGAQPGPITIATNFGETESDFWFRDDRNIIASFDSGVKGLWHGPNYIVSSDDVIPVINGNFIRMKKKLNAWEWFELYVGPANSDVSIELKNIPADAIANPDKYSLKFEINTLASLTGANIRIYIGNGDLGTDRGTNYYVWEPNVDTGGMWETVAIPWKDIHAANKDFEYNPNGYNISIHFSGPSPVNGDFGLDNMRVVPD